MQQKAPTLFQLWFWLITRFIGWLVIGAFGCLAVAIVIVIMHGKQAGITNLQVLVQTDYRYLLDTLPGNKLLMINHWLGLVPQDIKVNTRLLPIISQAYQAYFWMIIHPFVQAILLGTQLLMIRLYLLLRWCPLFLLLGLIGLIDGLAQRYIRRTAAGRESALIYHNAKPLVMLSLLLGIFIDLVLPISMTNAEWILAASALLFGIAIQVTAKSFKKYL
jgi:integrating conjugative element membrane protein (TIGR03747 family)